MKFKVIVILKNEIEHEHEYICNGIKKEEIREVLIKSLESESKEFYIIGDNRFDFYLKNEIKHISIEYID